MTAFTGLAPTQSGSRHGRHSPLTSVPVGWPNPGSGGYSGEPWITVPAVILIHPSRQMTALQEMHATGPSVMLGPVSFVLACYGMLEVRSQVDEVCVPEVSRPCLPSPM